MTEPATTEPTATQRWLLAHRLPIHSAVVLLLVGAVGLGVRDVSLGHGFPWNLVIVALDANVLVALSFSWARQRYAPEDRGHDRVDAPH